MLEHTAHAGPSRLMTQRCALVLILSLSACGSDDRTKGAATTEPDGGDRVGCTRPTLSDLSSAYFTALAAREPGALSVSPSVRVTENGRETTLGQGLWQTAGSLQFKRDLLDTDRCSTLSHAVIDTEGGPTIVGLRLKLEDDQISEVETYVVPQNGFLVNPAGVSNDGGAAWESIIPIAERSTREELNAMADRYFNLFGPTPEALPFAAACQRFENGSVAPGVTHCSEGIPRAGSVSVTGRRYPIADIEAGVAAGFALLFGSLGFHLFKVLNGEITGIHATVASAAASSGWE